MIDPTDPLAHLYTLDDVDDDGAEIEIPTRTSSLEELLERTADVEDFTERDADELALIVADQIEAGTMTPTESIALGITEVDDPDTLTPIGKAVVKRLLDRVVFAHAAGSTWPPPAMLEQEGDR